MSYYVHESSYVDDGAHIGAGTNIWHFCHVMSGARIGRDCSLGQNVFVARGVTLGDHVRVQNNVSIYEGVLLEDYVFCGPSMVFTNVRSPRAAVRRNTSSDYLTTHVCAGASIGANATIVCGVTIGAFAMIGAGAVVTRDVPPHALMLGVPARPVGWACWCGLTLPQDLRCGTCGRTHVREPGGGLRLDAPS